MKSCTAVKGFSVYAVANRKQNEVNRRGRFSPRNVGGNAVARRNQHVIAHAAVVANTNWDEINAQYQVESPLQVMDSALKTWGDDIAIAFSGAEDVALIEYAHLTGRPFRVFSLDTGRLNPETYRLFADVERRYKINIEYTFPDSQECMDLVRTKGMFSFYEDGHQECCRVRKVRPLRRQLKTLKAWVTGQRKDQSPGTRAEIPIVQVDPVFEGLDGGEGSLIKYNPLANVSTVDVWSFLRDMDVPVNDLHAQGYVSIGCEPCTRPVLPNQHEREGRWWWEDATSKECGLHSGNISDTGSGEGEVEKKDLYQSVPKVEKQSIEALLSGGRSHSTLAVFYAPWCQYCQALEDSLEEVAGTLHQGDNVKVIKFQADVEREFAEEKFGLETFPMIGMFPKGSGSKSFIKYPSVRRDVDSLMSFVRMTNGPH